MNAQEAKKYVAKIREAYPNPMTGNESILHREGYCVGGAFFRFCGIEYYWPGPIDLGSKLVKQTAADASDMLIAAHEIINNNDKGNFEGAWETLEQALTTETCHV